MTTPTSSMKDSVQQLECYLIITNCIETLSDRYPSLLNADPDNLTDSEKKLINDTVTETMDRISQDSDHKYHLMLKNLDRDVMLKAIDDYTLEAGLDLSKV